MIYLKLFWSFFQIGLFSIGGGYAAIPLIQNQVVDINSWLTMSKFADIVILNKTPLEDIAVLHEKQTIAMVLRDGFVEYTDNQYRDHYKIGYYEF